MQLRFQNLIDSPGQSAGTPFGLVLPNGPQYCTGKGDSAFEVVLQSDAALLPIVMRGHVGLLEAYFDQEVDIEGDLGAALAAGIAAGLDVRVNALSHIENDLHELRRSNRNQGQAKTNARAHYGLGTEFYRLWLDHPLMMYTCGYWPAGTQTLEEAQRQKIDHVCRKLRLAVGERFVDIGCGFGGFMFRAFETTGALGTGINTTTEQVKWLHGEIQRRRLASQLAVREADFRDVDGPYD